MTVTYGFFNAINSDRKYNAIQMSELFDGLIEDGVYLSQGDAFAVTQNTVPDLHVQVGEGRAWFKHTWTKNDAHILLDIETPDILYPRIDSAVLEVNRSDSIRANTIKIVKGTPAASPVEPTMQHTSVIDQYRLANIAVAANDTEIINADITIKVGTAETPYVAGVLSSFDVETLLAQWDSYFDNTWLPARENEMETVWWPALSDQLEAEFDAWLATLEIRDKLTADRIYYVRSDGNDSNDGLSDTPGGAWLTIQHGVDFLSEKLDLGPYSVTIALQSGATFNENVKLRRYLGCGGGYSGYGGIANISGGATINATDTAISGDNCGIWRLSAFHVTSSINGIVATGLSELHLSGINFGACTNAHCWARNAGNIKFENNYTISGDATMHFLAENGGIIDNSYIQGNFNPLYIAFTTFAVAKTGGIIISAGDSYTNKDNVTGSRYNSIYNAIINTSGQGENNYPGNSAGSTSYGGLYI